MQFTGYAVLTHQEPHDILDWESVSDTVEGAMEHAKTWHDAGECSIVRVTAEVELVASVVECAEPEEVEASERLLFT